MSSSPTCGLLIPCKNGARFLPRLFNSIRSQTHPFSSIWLFDDGSTDGSAELAAELGASVIRSEKSIGPAAARNRLVHACECEWLHFHDADDTLSPDYLLRIISRISQNVEVIICEMNWVTEETGRVENKWTYDAASLSRHPISYMLLNTVGGINGMYRRSVLLAVGGFDESLRYWEDMDLNIRLQQNGARTAVINESLVTAYRYSDSYSNSHLGEVWRQKLRIMERLLSGADQELRATIASESETIANRQALLNLWIDVPGALELARKAGGNPPATGNLLLRALKLFLPATWAFRLQFRHRTSTRR